MGFNSVFKVLNPYWIYNTAFVAEISAHNIRNSRAALICVFQIQTNFRKQSNE
jgi:hypothetical protein